MKRSEFKRKPVEAGKPPKRKTRKCAIKGCANRFEPKGMMHKACSVPCALDLIEREKARKQLAAEKAERAEIARRKKEGMTIKEHLKATEKLINRCVVLRDWFHGCISCHMPSHYDGIWTASHFKSVGSNSALRFNTWNIHKGCEQCNLFKSGNIAEYEKRLLLKVGPERVEWLKCHKRERDYTKEYLIRMQAVARRWIKRKEKRLGIK